MDIPGINLVDKRGTSANPSHIMSDLFSPLYYTYYVTIKTYYVTIMSLIFLQFLDYNFILCRILENSYCFSYFNTIILIFLALIISIISIKTQLWHLFLIKCIMSLFLLTCIILISFCFYCQLLLLKHIMTLLKHLFLFNYIICIMSFDVYYVNYLYDNKLFQLFSIISFQFK